MAQFPECLFRHGNYNSSWIDTFRDDPIAHVFAKYDDARRAAQRPAMASPPTSP